MPRGGALRLSIDLPAGLVGALLACSLLLPLPVEIARLRALCRLAPEEQDIGAPWNVGLVGAGIMERTIVVNRRAAGWNGTGYGRRDVDAVDLQPMDAGVVIDRMVRQHLPLVAARHKLHTAVREGGLLKGHPDAEGLVVQGGIPIRFVLVPGRL